MLFDHTRFRIQKIKHSLHDFAQESESEFSGEGFLNKIPGLQVSGRISTIPLMPQDATALLAWLHKHVTFDIHLGQLSYNPTLQAAALVVDGFHPAGSNTLSVRNAPPSNPDLFPMGCVLRSTAGTKTYFVDDATGTDPSGHATLSLAAPLLKDQSDGTALKCDTVPFHIRRTSRVISMSEDATADTDRVVLSWDFKEHY